MIAVMPVQLASIWVAVAAVHVQEVIGPRPWVALPGAPPYLPGVIPWRGRAIAVLDLGALLAVAPPLAAMDAGREASPRTLIAQVDATVFAIPADHVREVHELEGVEANHATQVRLAHGQVEIAGQVMPVVDLGLALAAVLHPTEGAA